MSKAKVLRDRNITEFGMPSLEHKHRGITEENFNQDIAVIERTAYEKGFSAGEQAGYTVGEEKALMLLERLEDILTEMTELKKKVMTEAQPQVFALSVAMAKKILRDEIRQNPEIIINLIKAAMEKIERTGTITIKINPALKELISNHKPELLAIHPEIRFNTDPSIPLASPLVVGPEEEVITDFESQLTNLVEDLGEEIGNSNA
ncbi:MAG: FliH/SctL family protein [Nitrospirota bacterium]|nr:FliH/SctL family protein [Nitrospirota bacterium]